MEIDFSRFKSSSLPEKVKKLWSEQRNPQFVFVNAKGSPFDINHIVQRDFKKLLMKARLPSSVRFHDLRHTYASQFVMAGGKLEVLQKLLGHKTLEMTQRYAHLAKEVIREASSVVTFGSVLPSKDILRQMLRPLSYRLKRQSPTCRKNFWVRFFSN